MRKKKSGFTLIEIIIVMSLTVILIGVTCSIFIIGQNIFKASDIKSTFQMEARDIQERIGNALMQGVSVEGCISGGREISGEKYESLTSILVDINGEKVEKTEWINILELKIRSFSKDTPVEDETILNTISYHGLNNLLFNSSIISSQVKTIRIRPGNINDKDSSLSKASSMDLNIILENKRGPDDLDYPINFSITFRNKG